MDLQTELFNKELMCSLLRVTADYDLTSVHLILYPNNCTDMAGAIKFSKRLMPNVTHIMTVSGRERETAYILEHGKWRAYSYKSYKCES